MFELLQIIVKCIVIVSIILVAFFAVVKVWRADLDLRHLCSPRKMVEQAANEKLSWLPTRENDAIYQNGRIVGRIMGDAVNDDIISFSEIYQCNEFDFNSEFEFRKWRLRLDRIDEMIMNDSSASHKGKIMRGISCKIVGERSL